MSSRGNVIHGPHNLGRKSFEYRSERMWVNLAPAVGPGVVWVAQEVEQGGALVRQEVPDLGKQMHRRVGHQRLQPSLRLLRVEHRIAPTDDGQHRHREPLQSGVREDGLRLHAGFEVLEDEQYQVEHGRVPCQIS
ncbi:MAG TPA: hypothetical protein VIJ07_13810 [Dermatophilaceae bacterium]